MLPAQAAPRVEGDIGCVGAARPVGGQGDAFGGVQDPFLHRQVEEDARVGVVVPGGSVVAGDQDRLGHGDLLGVSRQVGSGPAAGPPCGCPIATGSRPEGWSGSATASGRRAGHRGAA
jgi:hypothetical protein